MTEFFIYFEGTGPAASTSALDTSATMGISSCSEYDIIFIEKSAKVVNEMQGLMNLAPSYLFQQPILQNHFSSPVSKVLRYFT